MIKWKQRLYAFLLRRVLGPFLDAASQQKLHDSIEVSFHEGIFTLNHVGLNTSYLNTLLMTGGGGAPSIRIRKARVASISIQLSLLEGQEIPQSSSNSEAMNQMAPSSYSSLARKAMNLGTAAVALVANVEIDGIQLEVEPIPRDPHTITSGQQQPEISTSARSPSRSSSSGSASEEEPAAPKGYLASYMEAALSSLQMTLNLTNLSVRICQPAVTPTLPETTTAWVEVRLPSLSYQDMDSNKSKNVSTAAAPINSQSSSPEHAPPSPPSSPSSSYRTILEKSVTFQGITIAAGETTRTLEQDGDGSSSSHSSDSHRMVEFSSLVSVIALAEGTGHISVRAVEYGSNNKSKMKGKSRAKPILPQVQQDIDVRLNQQIKVSVDETSIVQLKSIVEGFQSMSSSSNVAEDGNSSTASQDAATTQRPLQRVNSVASSTSGPSLNSINSRDDEMELYTITGMMKQYNEAKALAEQNQMRGGILLPSNAYEEGENVGVGDSRTFDVFFDANEKSFHHYASMMKSSILASQEVGLSSDFVHTKLRFHLLGGGMKVSFRNRSNTSESLLRPDEYILMTFNDVDITSQVSGKRAEYALHVSHLEIDDAHIPQNEVNSFDASRVEIGSLLSFAQTFEDTNGGDILVEPSCISLHLNIDSGVEGGPRCCDFELSMKPIELVYRHDTVAHITALAATLGDKGGSNSESSDSTLQMKDSVVSNDSQDNNQLRINSALCTVGSLTVSFPVLGHPDFSPLYSRCGYKIGECITNKPALGLTLDNLTVEHRRRGGKTGESSVEPEMTTSLECHSVICFASSPEKGGSLAGRISQRIDIFAATGRCEVNPCIPIAVEYRRNLSEGADGANFGTECFPTVPAFTSFKARQEDEDEDAEIDRILSEKLRDVNVDSRRSLRAKDPQSEMLEEAGNCDAVIMLHIPEVLVDVSREEIESLLDMIHCILPTKQNSPESSKISPPSHSPSLSVSLACDSISLSFHNQELSQGRRWNSHLVRFDRCRAHTISGGSSMKFIRFLSHETTLYEILDRGTSKIAAATPYSVQNKLANIQNRSQRTKSSTTVPIFYRSKLFPALSQGSPSILLDYIQPRSTSECSLDSASESEQSVFLSIYNMTNRYDPNSEWLDRLQATFKDLNLKGKKYSQEQNNQSGETSMSPSNRSCLTRVYFSLADCNVDYTSLRHFKTSSRSILRLGDLRLSSNIMTPSVANQAFSLSIGDISWYLCNTRCPHNLENALLPGAQAMLPPTDIPSKPLDQSEPQLNSRTEIVFREMGFKTILTLESIEAILAKKNTKDRDSIKGACPGTQEPQLTISLTLGELSLYACKDSFQCFTETIGELQTNLTALTNEDLKELTKVDPKIIAEPAKKARVSENCNIQAIHIDRTDDLFLDGYDWTTIDHDSKNAVGIPPGQEQTARWYGSPHISVENADDCVIEGDSDHQTVTGPRLIHHHFPLEAVSNPLQGGDMDAAKLAGTDRVSVNTRILLHDMKVKVRFFDGYDWPDFQVQRKSNPSALFVIDEAPVAVDGASAAGEKSGSSEQNAGRRAQLMGDLLAGSPGNSGTFQNMPLPEERVQIFLTQKELRRLSRRTNSYVQFSAQGVSLRLDSYRDSPEHRLKSCLDLSLKDFFLAETISNSTPIKMIGEWFNEVEHPRDSKDGLLMFKMTTWDPLHPLSTNNELASDECEVALTLAPVRCILDQRAIKFMKAFFNNDNGEVDPSPDWTSDLNTLPPPMLRLFRVKPVKMKIDYSPQKIDTAALKNGSVVELINLSPLDAMCLLLHQVEIENSLGFGEAMGSLVSHWLGDICATQMHKFLTNARPFEPFTNVGGGVSDLLVLPWDAYKSGESVSRALKSSISSLVGTVAHETLTTSSRITGFIAGEMAKATISPSSAYNSSSSASSNNSLPSRPLGTPRRVGDTANHALESLARGVQTANYKVIVVPYREYRRSGTKGAVKSIVKGIPIAVAAPVSGASEAISYTLLGARNQIRPDIRKEEEASQRGLHYGGV